MCFGICTLLASPHLSHHMLIHFSAPTLPTGPQNDKTSMLNNLLSNNAQQAEYDRNETTESEPSPNQSAHVPLQVAATTIGHTDVETNQL